MRTARDSRPLRYSAEPIEGWVVDKESGQALEGVIVVAHWQLEGGLEGNIPVGQMMVLETITNAQGRYYFAEWGPKWRPWNGKLKTRSPEILIFKSGYRYEGLANELNNKSLRGELEVPLKSDWNGKTIGMELFKGTQKEYKDMFEYLPLLNSEWVMLHFRQPMRHDYAFSF